MPVISGAVKGSIVLKKNLFPLNRRGFSYYVHTYRNVAFRMIKQRRSLRLCKFQGAISLLPHRS